MLEVRPNTGLGPTADLLRWSSAQTISTEERRWSMAECPTCGSEVSESAAGTILLMFFLHHPQEQRCRDVLSPAAAEGVMASLLHTSLWGGGITKIISSLHVTPVPQELPLKTLALFSPWIWLSSVTLT